MLTITIILAVIGIIAILVRLLLPRTKQNFSNNSNTKTGENPKNSYNRKNKIITDNDPSERVIINLPPVEFRGYKTVYNSHNLGTRRELR